MGDDSHDPGAYGRAWAETYDEVFVHLDASEAVDTVAQLTGGGAVLEWGIGTGRLALPLAERGLAVTGVDASPEMIAHLRAKAGGADIAVEIGDFVDYRVESQFSVVLLACNTLFGIQDQDRQVACFANAARHLSAGGVFVVEAFVPDPGRFDRGQRVAVTRLSDEGVALEVAVHDPVAQVVQAREVSLRPAGVQVLPLTVRYAWPAEFDLMARLAGLRLRYRWGGWDRSPFSAASSRHVSVYESATRVGTR